MTIFTNEDLNTAWDLLDSDLSPADIVCRLRDILPEPTYPSLANLDPSDLRDALWSPVWHENSCYILSGLDDDNDLAFLTDEATSACFSTSLEEVIIKNPVRPTSYIQGMTVRQLMIALRAHAKQDLDMPVNIRELDDHMPRPIVSVSVTHDVEPAPFTASNQLSINTELQAAWD